MTAMVDLHRLPTLAPELYETHSRLAEARIPMGATVTHIYRARRWRLTDSIFGEGYARRSRIRARTAARPAFVFVPNEVIHKHKSGSGYRPPSHKGYA
jgi:hypothetical protein